MAKLEHALEVLQHAESVLMKRIREMRDGKPKDVAKDKLYQIRDAIALVKEYGIVSEQVDEIQDEKMIHYFTHNPPIAEA
jgi:hypothetical protein